MRKNKWFIDVTLVAIIIVLAVFVVMEMRRMVDFIGRDQGTSTSVGQSYPLNDTEPHPTPEPDLEDTSKVLAPDFELVNLSGETVALSDFRGKAVLVNFWATWCPPCRSEMPLIDSFAEKHEEDLVVLAVNAGESESDVRSFVETHSLDFEFLLDPDNSIVKLYRINGFPTSLFIDEKGFLQGTHIGELDEVLMTAYLEKIGLKE